MNKTYFTIYKVTNKINGKLYIGAHRTKNLDDDYMGSGKYLNRAIEKHGLENFEKEILHVFDNPREMWDKEKEIVNEDFLSEENTYNLKIGGSGGWDYVNKTSDHFRDPGPALERHKFLLKNDPDYLFRFLQSTKHGLEKIKQMRNDGLIKPSFLGRKHSDISKRRISKSLKGKLSGERNGQFSKKWIFSESQRLTKRIDKDEIVPDGWSEGRVIDFSVYDRRLHDIEKMKEKKIQKKIDIKKKYEKLFVEFSDSGLSLNKFSKVCGILQPNLSTNFKKYIKDY